MTSPLQEAFHAGYIASRDAENPHLATSQVWDAFELGKFYRATARIYEPIHKSHGDTYKGLRSGEVFRFSYDPLRIEPVQDARIEQSGRGR
jgi:hypothetical protein